MNSCPGSISVLSGMVTSSTNLIWFVQDAEVGDGVLVEVAVGTRRVGSCWYDGLWAWQAPGWLLLLVEQASGCWWG